MAYSTMAVFGLILITGFFVGAGIFESLNDYSLRVADGSSVQSEILDDVINTRIQITNVSYDAGSGWFVISVENAGGTTLNPDQVFLVDGDTWVQETSTSHNMGDEYWEPGETLMLNYTAGSGARVFKVVVGNGISDGYRYTP
jgi:archaellum component FlaF (FlaF/FlaG flagellin family)